VDKSPPQTANAIGKFVNTKFAFTFDSEFRAPMHLVRVICKNAIARLSTIVKSHGRMGREGLGIGGKGLAEKPLPPSTPGSLARLVLAIARRLE